MHSPHRHDSESSPTKQTAEEGVAIPHVLGIVIFYVSNLSYFSALLIGSQSRLCSLLVVLCSSPYHNLFPYRYSRSNTSNPTDSYSRRDASFVPTEITIPVSAPPSRRRRSPSSITALPIRWRRKAGRVPTGSNSPQRLAWSSQQMQYDANVPEGATATISSSPS